MTRSHTTLGIARARRLDANQVRAAWWVQPDLAGSQRRSVEGNGSGPGEPGAERGEPPGAPFRRSAPLKPIRRPPDMAGRRRTPSRHGQGMGLESLPDAELARR